MHNNQQRILQRMKKREACPTQTYIIFDKRNSKCVRQIEVPEDCQLFLFDIVHPHWVRIPVEKCEIPKVEAYHNKVHSWLLHQTMDRLQEIFTISDHHQVQRLLEKLQEVRTEVNGDMEGKLDYNFFKDHALQGSSAAFKNFKVAWISSPIIFVEPKWALEWLQETLESVNFFFPFEKACNELLTPDGIKEFRRFNRAKRFKIKQLDHLLAVYLRKSIISTFERAIVPSHLATLRKIRKHADQTTYLSAATLNNVFRLSFYEAIKNQCRDLPKNLSHLAKEGRRIEETYYQKLHNQALKLLEKEEGSQAGKQSRRAKRNQKKATQKENKQKQLDEALPASEDSSAPINPEESHAACIVEMDAYKIGEQEENNVIPASKSQETKEKTPEMHQEEFLPPQSNLKSLNTSSSSNCKQRTSPNSPVSNRKKHGHRRNNKRKYEEKKNAPEDKFERIVYDYQEEAVKAASNVIDGLLVKKLTQLQSENNDAWELKNVAYRNLLDYFRNRLPYFGVELFGSLASGVTLPNSDVDVLLTSAEGMQIPPFLLHDISFELSQATWVTHCSAILSAKIPVVKVIVDPFVSYDNPISRFKLCSHEQQMAMPFLIKFDITVNTVGPTNTGLLSTAFMKSTFTYQPRLLEAMLVVKHILEAAGLTEGYRGGISSYNIFIMFICFSEHKKIDLTTALSDILLAFFNFYTSEFDHRSSVLRYESGQRCVLTFEEYECMENAESLGVSGAMKIMDPINGKLVRASFSRYEEVLNLFRELANAFRAVEEEARLTAQPLMGRRSNSWEVLSNIQAQIETSESAGGLARWLLLN